jgi:serine/alanine adding enzyme
MALEILAIDDSRWPELVRQAEADVFYEPSYCRFLTEGTPHVPVMLLYEDGLGKVFDVTLTKVINSLPFFADIADQFPQTIVDLASPDYNSPIIIADPRDSKELLKRYRRSVDQYCREMGVITEFIRFHPLSESTGICAQILELHPGSELIYIDLRSGYESAFHGYRKGHKSTIKKAAREGADYRFCTNSDMDGLAKAYQLYIETMLRKDAKSVYLHSFEHFKNMVRHLGDRIVLMQSLAGGEIASANIFLLGRKHMWFKYSGLDQHLRASGAHTFMLDRAIYWACEQGVDYFMLGGGMDVGDSTYASKRGFSHRSACIHHTKKIHNEKTMNFLVEAKRAYDSRLGLPTRTSYFPSYWLS